MQAALTASKRGHNVILCEKSDSLGGVLKCEAEVPFKKHLHQYLEHQKLMISRGPIEVRLNTAVTTELAAKLEPDVIITAMGAEPVVPDIRDIDGSKVMSAEALYIQPDKAGKRIVILGCGLVGSELAIYMAGKGHEVTVVEMAPMLNSGGNILQGQSIGIEIARLGIKLALSTKVIEISEVGVTGEGKDGRVFFPADTVVCAVGLKARRAEAAALNLCAPEFYQIGDCVSANNIYQASNAAYHTAINIGRPF
jgi:pyruvate/2-oxoglutarate dehydrogenase complex dihydrolipoamide dehydrogenase (E3) component